MMSKRSIATVIFAVSCGSVVALCSGCSRNVRLAGEEIPPIQVKAVEHYGLTLDEHAPPEQVAFVTLRAIREDFEATTKDARDAALAIQLDMCAANELQAINDTGLPTDEFLYDYVRRWTPTVAHYVSNFDKDWETAQSKYVATKTRTENARRVLLNVADPAGLEHAGAVVLVDLMLDTPTGGGEPMYRVVRISFASPRREVGGKKRAGP